MLQGSFVKSQRSCEMTALLLGATGSEQAQRFDLAPIRVGFRMHRNERFGPIVQIQRICPRRSRSANRGHHSQRKNGPAAIDQQTAHARISCYSPAGLMKPVPTPAIAPVTKLAQFYQGPRAGSTSDDLRRNRSGV
jgi:hypothetical protein